MTSISNAGLDRRQMLRRAVWLAGGVAALSAFGDGKAFAEGQAPFFDRQHRAILDAVSDIIVPATDTPGARDAGVPAFIDAMMANWASDDTRLQLANVLDAVDARARVETGLPFLQLPAERRAAFVRDFDAEAFATGDGPWRRFKELVLTGYYLSEAGATKELRYVQVPGAWHADIAFGEGDRAWAV
jgi:gluconate 2-dehydrogenase gamma chain